MTWSEFYQALKGGNIAPVYLFTGPEAYIKREALSALRAKVLQPGLEALNDQVLEGVDAQAIIDACETLPMLCERRVVTVRDWAPLMKEKAKNEERDTERISAWLENPPVTCVLVFYMRGELDKRKKLSALLSKKATVVSFDLLSDPDLRRWCAGRLKPLGKSIDVAALNTLTYMAGRELTRLSGELDKLAAYVGEARDMITEADVRAIVPPSLEYNVFEILNNLLAGDVAKGQETVNRLLQGGQTPTGVFAMMTRQIRQLAHMKCALDAGTPVQVVQEQLKLHPYAAKQTARQCAKLSADWLTTLYERCVASDFDVKSGRLRDKEALDALILEIGLADAKKR